MRALGIPRLTAEPSLTRKRPNIPLSQLTSGHLKNLLSLIDQWIQDVRAHADPKTPTEPASSRTAADQLERSRFSGPRRPCRWIALARLPKFAFRFFGGE
jgi:hypothetical protein